MIAETQSGSEKLSGKVRRSRLKYSQKQCSYSQGRSCCWKGENITQKCDRELPLDQLLSLQRQNATSPSESHADWNSSGGAPWLNKEQLYDLSETAADRASLPGCRAKNGPGGVIPEDVESHILSIKVTAETFCASLCVGVNKRNRFRISYL